MNMRELFPEEYPVSSAGYQTWWESGIFVFDTNVLLMLYAYSDRARDQFFETIEALSERKWMPFQVAKEFYDRRIEVIDKEANVLSTVLQSFNKWRTAIEQIEKHSRDRE